MLIHLCLHLTKLLTNFSMQRSRNGEHDTVLLGWTGDNGDPDHFLSELLSCRAAETGANRAGWCDRQFEDLIRQARTSGDPAERAALYRQAQARFKDQAPWMPLAHSVEYVAMRSEVEGFTLDPLGGFHFHTVRLAE